LPTFLARIPSSSYESESKGRQEEGEAEEEGGMVRELEWKPSEGDCRGTKRIYMVGWRFFYTSS